MRALLRDLRAAAREPGARAGPAGRGRVADRASRRSARSFRSTRSTTLGRDVNNAIVVEDAFASAEHAVLTFRGRAWYVEDLGSTNGTFVNGGPVEGVAPLGFGDEIQIGQVRFRLERAAAMSAPTAADRGRDGRCRDPRRRSGPGFRGRELGLLRRSSRSPLVAGSVSLGPTRPRLPSPVTSAGDSQPGRPAAWRSTSAPCAAHLAQVLAGRRTDQILLPAVGMLGGHRAAADGAAAAGPLASTPSGGRSAWPTSSSSWLLIAFAIVTRPGDRRSARTTGCAATSTRGRRSGSGCCCSTFVFGRDVNGARLDAQDRPDQRPAVGAPEGHPRRLPGGLPVREPAAARRRSTRAIGPLRLPPLPYLAPMVAMWAIALGIVVVQRDLGAALLFFAVFLLAALRRDGPGRLRRRRARRCSSPAAR